MMGTQVIINAGLVFWLIILSYLGLRHDTRDRKIYDEIYELIGSLRSTLHELREEMGKHPE